MCGISGLWSPTPLSQNQHTQLSSVFHESLRHRGPDAYGSWSSPDSTLLFTHRRLSVVDLSAAGHQPMTSPSGRYTIVFNGEIYNHNKLRRELSTDWRGTSDTETLLALFDAHGVHKSLHQLVGMFAFAVWDSVTEVLHLCRDRFGEKPLYYGHITYSGQHCLTFSSELAPYLNRTFEKPSINPHSLSPFFSKSCIDAPLTIFSGFTQLLPGTIVSFQSPQLSPKQTYWWSSLRQARTAFSSQRSLSSPSDLNRSVDDLQHLLCDVISDQLSADVPVGAFLSGGIDSSLVCSIAQKCLPKNIQSFTISFPDDPLFDESVYAQQIADSLQIEHTTIPVSSSDLLQTFKKIPQLISEPFADSSLIPSLLVSQSAKAYGLSVALTGDGADELFGGYNRHQLLPLIHRYTSLFPQSLLDLSSSLLSRHPVSTRGLLQNKLTKLSVVLAYSKNPRALYEQVTSIFQDPSDLLLTPHSQLNHSGLLNVTAPSLSEYYMLLDTLLYLPSDILTKVDRASMAASLETRAPFLDHRVAMFAWSLHADYKVSRLSKKIILKKLLSRYLPENLFLRPKSGFALPVGQWFRKPLRTWVEDCLDPHILHSQGILNVNAVSSLWSSHLAGFDRTQELWSVLVWQSWYNHYLSS